MDIPVVRRRVRRMERTTLLLLLALFIAAEASAIIYPGQLDHTEGDECPIDSGRTGTCSRSCGNFLRQEQPPRCGIKDSAFLVCCDKIQIHSSLPITDVAPPAVTFECGRNARNMLTLSFSYVGEKKIYVELEDYDPIKSYTEKTILENGTEIVTEYEVGGVGGEMAEKNAWPWMALVGERNGHGINWFCGGVLINEQWVLSALHCFLYKKAETVRLGEHNYKDENDGALHQDFDVVETVNYPGYAYPEAYHDLALLKLSSRVHIQEFISPVCLPWAAESEVDITGHPATLTGYGDTEFQGIPTSYLQEINMTVFPSVQCDRSYSNLLQYANTWPKGIGQETLCAGDPNGGRDACQGDSGGPLVTQDAQGRFVLAGIVSRGYGCGHKDYPGLYVNIRHKPYLTWIKEIAFTSL
ncbi:Clotting factor B [Portunus trituberculatus]|uniref:Clotting factor B n=1 Tax=Portunus trituberculatus TaxID=210409 RepID=A0A5B7F5L1_PORTR|nr:Clotting factor B [Portunus trituberculatus]